jgi:hypothetical protein
MTDQIISYNNLPFHPLAEKFPLMEGDDLQKLVDDIKANGLREQIVIHEGKVLDGRNRYRAAKLAKINLAPNSFRELPVGTDPKAYVISANLHRRHLTAEQKRDLLAELIKIDPSKSNRQIAEDAKVSHHTVGEVRDGLEAHVAYKRKQEELINLLKETHSSYSQAQEWADNTKQRLDETLADIGQELDQQNAAAA